MPDLFQVPDFIKENQAHNDKLFKNKHLTASILYETKHFKPLADQVQSVLANYLQNCQVYDKSVRIKQLKHNPFAITDYLKTAWYAAGAGTSNPASYMVSITNIFGLALPQNAYTMHIAILLPSNTNKALKTLTKKFLEHPSILPDVVVTSDAHVFQHLKQVRDRFNVKPTILVPDLVAFVKNMTPKIPLPSKLVKILTQTLQWHYELPFMRWIEHLPKLKALQD